MRLLVVDDSPSRHDIINRAALRVGFSAEEITIATNRREALAIIAGETRHNLCVIDISLTDDGQNREGFDVIRAQRNRHPDSQIICYSSHSENVGVGALLSGANTYISTNWPFNSLDFLERELAMRKGCLELREAP